LPTHETMMESMRWAGDFLTGAMRDWPDYERRVGSLLGEKEINQFPASRFASSAEERDQRRGRFINTMHWRIASDEALILEFENYDGFWMFTNMGTFWNSMDFLYRPVSYTPSRAAVDIDNRVRLVMTHADPGYHNWLDTQGFEEGYLTYRNVQSRVFPPIETKLVKLNDLAEHLPKDSRRVTAEERSRQMHERFDAIRRRYRI
jgi:hypothetical protein